MEILGWTSTGEKVKEILFDSYKNRLIFGCGQEILFVDSASRSLDYSIIVKKGFDCMALLDSKHNLAYGDGGSIMVIDTIDRGIIKKIRTQEAGFQTLDWSICGEFIVVGMYETEILIMDALKSTLIQRLDQKFYSDRSRNKVRFIDSRSSFLSSSYNSLSYWAKQGKKFVLKDVYTPKRNEYGQIVDWDVSPDGKFIVVLLDQEQSYNLTLWNVKNNEVVKQQKLPGLSLRVSWCPKNDLLALAEWEKVSIWDASTLKCINPGLKSENAYEPTSLAYNKEGSILWAGTENGNIIQWNLLDIELQIDEKK